MQGEKNVRLQKRTFGREVKARLQCSPVIISASPGVRSQSTSQSRQLCLQGLWALGECASRTQHSNDVNTKLTAHHKTSNIHKTHTHPTPRVSTLSAAVCDLFLLRFSKHKHSVDRYNAEDVIIQPASKFVFLSFRCICNLQNCIYIFFLCNAQHHLNQARTPNAHFQINYAFPDT